MENNTLNFLDVSMIKSQNGKIKTKVYRKPKYSNQIINNKCKTPYRYKMAVIQLYIHVTVNICLDKDLVKQKINNTAEICEKVEYRHKLIKLIGPKSF